jgi:hypothetical protein
MRWPTPGVLLAGPNAGFVIATPIGLIFAAVFAAISVSAWAGPHAGTLLRHHGEMRAGLILAMVLWAIASLAALPPLDGPPGARPGRRRRVDDHPQP